MNLDGIKQKYHGAVVLALNGQALVNVDVERHEEFWEFRTSINGWNDLARRTRNVDENMIRCVAHVSVKQYRRQSCTA